MTAETDWELARKSVYLFLNNKSDEAESIFAENSDGFHVKVARCFISVLNAVFTFEDEKIKQATQLLQDMEKECSGDNGWIQSIKSRVFGTEETGREFIQRVERQVILAESQILTLVLHGIREDCNTCMRGFWKLRKSWRFYKHTYSQILDLYRRTFGENPSTTQKRIHSGYSVSTNGSTNRSGPSSSYSDGSISTHASALVRQNGTSMPSTSLLRNSLSMIFSFTGITTPQQTRPFVEPSEVARLMSIVSFGYGIFHLCISLIPPPFIKYVTYLGFEGDKDAGVNALMYTHLGQDMRAPLATLSLLMYYIMGPPFIFVDLPHVLRGICDARQLIAESQAEFRDSALFLIFTGKLETILHNGKGALEAYGKAVEISTHREIKLFCLYQLSWCHLTNLNYKEARLTLIQFQPETLSSQVFYLYVVAVCYGAEDKTEDVLACYRIIRRVIGAYQKTTLLRMFVSKRAPKLLKPNTEECYSAAYYRLLVYEMLFLWNTISACRRESFQDILNDCQACKDEEPMIGLTDLLEGFAYHKLHHNNTAIQCYQNCLNRRSEFTNEAIDQHISAFALFNISFTLIGRGKIEEGTKMLQRILTEYKNYDFEIRLKWCINNHLKRLKVPDKNGNGEYSCPEFSGSFEL